MKTAWVTVGAIAVIIFLGLGGIWYYLQNSSGPSAAYDYSGSLTTNSVLRENNADFAEAQRLSELNKFSEARVAYVNALQKAEDDMQAAQIKFRIAMMDYSLGDYFRAIDEFKLLVLDKQVPEITKAYAVLHMGRMYYLTHDPAIDAKLFEQEPYASFKVNRSFKESYIEFFKYGSEFYPLALLELYIADFYAEQLLEDFAGTRELTDAQRAEYITIINERVAAADRDIARTYNDYDAKILVPPALEIRANVTARLAGIGKETDKNVREAYQRAFDAYATLGRPGQDGFTRIWYAMYLLAAERGSAEGVQGIKSILRPLYTSSAYTEAKVATFLKARKNQDQIIIETLKALSKIDPDFKNYLKGLGWQEADF